MTNDFGGTIEQDPILRGEDDFQDEFEREKYINKKLFLICLSVFYES